jgi:hypothetical protein
MKSTLMASLLLCALLAGNVEAQDQKPAAASEEAAKPAPGPGQEPDPKIIEGMMDCMAAGLPENWQKAWFVIRQIGVDPKDKSRKYEANFFFATLESDAKGERLQTCGPKKVLEGVSALNAYLPDKQKVWSGATFTFYREGRYQANYDLTPYKPKPAKKAPAKKTQDEKK